MRTKLSDRLLPNYSNGEEIMNMVTHIVGGVLGIITLTLCVIRAAIHGSALGVITSCLFGFSMILLYTMSSVYHGLRPGTGKKVLQILDHCTIYVLIAGTYTPIVLCAMLPVYPVLAWVVFGIQWGCAALAITLTAIDLKAYNTFSMILYIAMGWCIIFAAPQLMACVGTACFGWILAGGIAYTIGAVLYGIGSKKRCMHSVFHIFVVIGSMCHAWAIYQYVL